MVVDPASPVASAVVCHCGGRKKKLGSVSEDISVRASCTTIIIKDAYEVGSYSVVCS